MLYIKVKDVAKKTPENNFRRVLRFLLELIIPKANPDFEAQIELVSLWLLEFEGIKSVPHREVGLDVHGKTILKMPYKENYGYWTDNNLTFEGFQNTFEIEEITGTYFNEKWDAFKE